MSDPRSQAAQAALSAAFSRAVDLSALKRPAPAPGDSNAPSTASGYVIDVTDATFEQVLQASARLPIVVDLWATWCEPCKQLSPVLEKLAAEGNGTWILAKVDVDANPAIAQAFQVQSIPTVVALAGGRPVAAFQGAQPEPQVRTWITQLLDQLREVLPGIKEAEAAAGDAADEQEPEPEDPRFAEAAEATDRGDHEAAVAAYRQILVDEPDNAEARSGLAWAELFQRADAAPADAAARSDADPADVDAAIAAADVDAASGETNRAFGRLIDAVRVAGDDRDRARDHLLALFALFAADDPEVIAARRALAAALY